MLSAEELHRRGLTASAAGRFAEARRWLTRAHARAADPNLAAQIEVSLAYVNAETGQGDEGLRLCRQALSRPTISARTRGIARSQAGLLLMRRGDAKRALVEFSAAVEALEEEPEYAARAHLNRGNVYLQQGQTALAHADFERSLAYADGLPSAVAKAQHNLGYTDLLRGDLVSALRLMEAAYPVLSELSPVYRAVVSQDRAEALITAGRPSEGLSLLRSSVRACAARRLRQFQGEAELALARAAMDTDPREAARAARQAARVFAAHGSTTWALRADAVASWRGCIRGLRQPELVERADELLPQLRRERLPREVALVDLYAARVHVRRGELAAAAQRLGRVRLGPSDPIGARLLRHEVRADLERARGRRTRSFAELRDGLAELQAWQASFGSLDLQSGVVGHGRQLAVDGLRMAVEDGRPDVLFEWSERARTLVTNVIPVRAPADETVSAELAELRWLQAQEPDPRTREGRRATELQQRIREHAWYGEGSGQVAEPASLGQLQAGLGAEIALVAYLVAGDRLVALTVTEAATQVRDLGHRARLDTVLGGLFPDLDMAGSDLPPTFAAPVRGQLTDRLGRLAGLLVDPVLEVVGDRRLVLTPSGALAGIPWPLLRGLVGRPVTVAQSATSWLARQGVPLRADRAGFVAGPRVPRALAEIEAAATGWPAADLLSGAEATAAAVSELAGRVDVLHVSAHGRHSAENPMFSGVELVDGPWFGYDIDQLPGVPDVVLLSACELGRSTVRYGEELVGMTAAWLHAGVRTVIASSAAVHDEVAHDVLVEVHRALGRGHDPAAALASAVPVPTSDAPPAPFVCFA
ncbi:MAG: CHAT domain-containing tetratricopeptide repeat protein [Nocardioides sp.]